MRVMSCKLAASSSAALGQYLRWTELHKHADASILLRGSHVYRHSQLGIHTTVSLILYRYSIPIPVPIVSQSEREKSKHFIHKVRCSPRSKSSLQVLKRLQMGTESTF